MTDDPTTSHNVTPEPQPGPATPGGAPSPAAPTWSAAAMPPVEPVQPVATPAKPKSGSSGRWLNVLLGVALVFAIGGVAFAIGRTTAPASAATARGNFPGGFTPGANGPNGSFAPGANGGGFLGGRGAGGLSISGTVTSVDGDKLTITTDGGQTVTLTTGDSTTYHTQAPASASDVSSGDKVSVKVDLAGRVTGNGNGNGNNGNGNGNNGNGGNGASGLSGTASDVTIIP
jgi:hypothetical protein